MLVFKKSAIEELKANQYLHIFVAKLVAQCKKTLKLFKDAKARAAECCQIDHPLQEMMEDDKSQYRRDLNKLTLVFSHMLAEFKTFFKDGLTVAAARSRETAHPGKYSADFKIVKLEARDFWDKAFGKRFDSKLH